MSKSLGPLADGEIKLYTDLPLTVLLPQDKAPLSSGAADKTGTMKL